MVTNERPLDVSGARTAGKAMEKKHDLYGHRRKDEHAGPVAWLREGDL